MLWLAWPPLPLTFFVFAGFVPLFIADHLITITSARFAVLKSWLCAYIAFVLWNALTTWWVCNSTLWGGIFAILSNAGLMTVPFLLSGYVRRYTSQQLGYFSFLVFWMSFEYLHLRWEFTWPWLTLGNVFALNHTWIQWYSLTGVFGGTLWVLAVNLLIFSLIRSTFFRTPGTPAPAGKKLISGWALVALIVLLPIAISRIMYAHTGDKGQPVNVTVVQPNIDPYTEKFSIPYDVQMDKMFRLSESGISDSTDYLVWPETAIPDNNIWLNDLTHQRPVQRLRTFIDVHPHLTAIVGINGAEEYDTKDAITATAREYIERSPPLGRADTFWVDFFNTAIQVDTSQHVPYYNKSKLVPGVERMPYPGTLKFLNYFVVNLGGISGSLGTQNKRTVFYNRDSIGVAPVICYESIFGEYCARYVRNGANLIFIITNDGWWGNTAGHVQHCLYAKLRCIENRRSLARSANTGTSCFINQRGDISQATQWAEDAAIHKTIYANDALTFYTRHGDFLARIAVAMTCAVILFTLYMRIKNRKHGTARDH